MILQIAYDLHGNQRNYDAVTRILPVAKVHSEGSVWFIDTEYSAGYWADAIVQASGIGGLAEVFVTRVYQNAYAGRNIDTPTYNWLLSPSRNW